MLPAGAVRSNENPPVILAISVRAPFEATEAASVLKSITEAMFFPAISPDPVRSASMMAKACLKSRAPKSPVALVKASATRKS